MGRRLGKRGRTSAYKTPLYKKPSWVVIIFSENSSCIRSGKFPSAKHSTTVDCTDTTARTATTIQAARLTRFRWRTPRDSERSPARHPRRGRGSCFHRSCTPAPGAKEQDAGHNNDTHTRPVSNRFITSRRLSPRVHRCKPWLGVVQYAWKRCTGGYFSLSLAAGKFEIYHEHPGMPAIVSMDENTRGKDSKTRHSMSPSYMLCAQRHTIELGRE